MSDQEKIKVTDKRIKEEGTEEQATGKDTSKYEKAAETFDSVTPFPKVDMSTFILSLSSSVLVHLGEVPEPETGKMSTDLPLARQTIDILSMLEEKTKGNLTEGETRLFRDILFELRMKYIQKAE